MAILAEIPEPAIGQPGWNVRFKAALDRLNQFPETILDILAQRIIAGTGMTVNYDPTARVFTLTSTAAGGASYTDEQVDDRVNALIKQGWGFQKIYDDVNNALTIQSRAFGTIPADHGLKGWSTHPELAVNSSALVPGVISLVRFRVHAADTIASFALRCNTAGVTISNCFMGLYSLAGARLGITADLSTVWNSTGEKTNTLTAAAAVTADTDYVAALLVGAAGTAPQFARGGTSNTANFGLTIPAFKYANVGASLTALPATLDFTTATAVSAPQFFVGYK